MAPTRRAALLAALGEVQAVEGLLQLDRLAYWPPGIVWLGPREVPDFLLQHAAELRTVLDREGVSYDRKAFKPHITLLRQVGRDRPLPEPLPLVWPVAGFRLVESCPDEAGAPYRVLGRFE